jgi:hypothetical protein
MALCVDATNIFALAFSVNAVFSVFGTQVRNAASAVSDCFESEFKSVDPSFTATGSDRMELERWVRLTVNGLRLGHSARFIPLVVALFFVVVSVVTLLQAALYGSRCQIDGAMLILFTLTSLLVAPLLYFGYSNYLSYVCRRVVARGIETPELRSAWLNIFRVFLDVRKEKTGLSELLEQAKRLKVERDLARFKKNLKVNFKPVLHPIGAYKAWTSKRHFERVLAEIEASQKESPNPGPQADG